MININLSMKQDKAIEIVTAIESPKFTYVGKQGMSLQFTTDGDEATAADVAKKTLKAHPDFKAMYFVVNVK